MIIHRQIIRFTQKFEEKNFAFHTSLIKTRLTTFWRPFLTTFFLGRKNKFSELS